MTLGTFYAAVAGGTATVMGVPHNAIAVSLLERLTGRQLGFFEWMIAGVPVFLTLLVVFYSALGAHAAGDPRGAERRGIPSGRAREAWADAAERAARALRVWRHGHAVHPADRCGS